MEMEDLKMQIHQKIKCYLFENGIKQAHLSRKTGIKKNTLNAALNGKRRLYAEEFGTICEALDISSEFFLGGKK